MFLPDRRALVEPFTRDLAVPVTRYDTRRSTEQLSDPLERLLDHFNRKLLQRTAKALRYLLFSVFKYGGAYVQLQSRLLIVWARNPRSDGVIKAGTPDDCSRSLWTQPKESCAVKWQRRTQKETGRERALRSSRLKWGAFVWNSRSRRAPLCLKTLWGVFLTRWLVSAESRSKTRVSHFRLTGGERSDCLEQAREKLNDWPPGWRGNQEVEERGALVARWNPQTFIFIFSTKLVCHTTWSAEGKYNRNTKASEDEEEEEEEETKLQRKWQGERKR